MASGGWGRPQTGGPRWWWIIAAVLISVLFIAVTSVAGGPAGRASPESSADLATPGIDPPPLGNGATGRLTFSRFGFLRSMSTAI